jgi:hypothetical protein
MLAAARRLIRAVQVLAHDGRIPKPLRGLAAFGVLPIPGPIDEAVLLIAGLVLSAFYRASLREAWSRATVPKLAPLSPDASTAEVAKDGQYNNDDDDDPEPGRHVIPLGS